MTYVGIDPGKGGGIAALNEDGVILLAEKMPVIEVDILTMLGWPKASEAVIINSHAVLELVRSSPQMGVVSAWRFGVGYGGLRMALAAACIPYDEVTPVKWQNAMQCRTGGDKNVSKRRAQELFPAVKVTHALSDALLLAEYCRRLRLGLLGKVT